MQRNARSGCGIEVQFDTGRCIHAMRGCRSHQRGAPHCQRATFLSRSALAITEMELKLMAAAAIIGFRSMWKDG